MFNKLAAAFVGKLFCLFVSCFFVELHANPINFLSNRRRFDIQRDTLLKNNPQKNKKAFFRFFVFSLVAFLLN